jgi:hypothetical protein
MSYLKDRILKFENSNQHYLQIKEALHQGNFQQKFKDFELKEDVVLTYRGKVYVPKSKAKNIVLRNAQCTLCRAPRISESNCSCKGPILLSRNEERGD